MQFPFHKLLQFIHIKIQFPHRIAFPRWRSHILKQTFHFGKVRMFIFLNLSKHPPFFVVVAIIPFQMSRGIIHYQLQENYTITSSNR